MDLKAVAEQLAYASHLYNIIPDNRTNGMYFLLLKDNFRINLTGQFLHLIFDHFSSAIHFAIAVVKTIELIFKIPLLQTKTVSGVDPRGRVREMRTILHPPDMKPSSSYLLLRFVYFTSQLVIP